MKEREKHKRICSIDPTTRGLAFSVMESPKDLVDWGTFTIRSNKNKACIKKVRDLIKYYEPEVIIVENADAEGSLRHQRIKSLISSIERLSENEGIETKSYSRLQIKELFVQFGSSTKYEIAKSISRWIPELTPHLPRERKPWMSEDERMNVFDAVSLALTYYYIDD